MKRLIAAILAAVLIVSAFAACSNQNKEVSEKNEALSEIGFTIDSHYENMDESSVRAYEKLCNAVVLGDNSVKFNVSMLEDVNKLFFTSFPLHALVEKLTVSGDSSGVDITYKNPLEKHKALVSEFYAKINEIKEQCEFGKVNADRYIFNVYTYITANFKLDSSSLTVFDTVIRGKGHSSALASLFEFLVLQGGAKACHALGASSILSYVQFKDEWYYFNPAADIEKNQGKALIGFAMQQSRTGDMDFLFTDQTEIPKVSDKKFDQLKNSLSFSKDGDAIKVICNNDETYLLEFN